MKQWYALYVFLYSYRISVPNSSWQNSFCAPLSTHDHYLQFSDKSVDYLISAYQLQRLLSISRSSKPFKSSPAYDIVFIEHGQRQGLLQYVISLWNSSWNSTSQNIVCPNLLRRYQIVLKFCTEYDSITAVPCATFRSDSATEMDAMGERDFTRF